MVGRNASAARRGLLSLAALTVPVALAAGCGGGSSGGAPALSQSPTSVADTGGGHSGSAPATSAGEHTGGGSAAGGGSSGHHSTPVPSSSSGGAGKHNAAASSRCHTSQLSVSVGDKQGAAGSVVQDVVFTNTARHACTMAGYPGVSYVAGDSGKQVGSPARRDHGRPVVTVRLAPGGHAYAPMSQPNPHNYGNRCDITKVRGIRVYPPDERAALYVADPGSACANTGVGRPNIQPVQADPA